MTQYGSEILPLLMIVITNIFPLPTKKSFARKVCRTAFGIDQKLLQYSAVLDVKI